MFAVHWGRKDGYPISPGPLPLFCDIWVLGACGRGISFRTSTFVFFFFSLKEVNRRHSHGKVWTVAPPLREPFSNEGWGAETSHFTVLAAGPGAFSVIVQRWEPAAAQELNSWCCLSPREQVTFPDNTAKRTLQRAAACFQAGHRWELGRPSPAHLSWL